MHKIVLLPEIDHPKIRKAADAYGKLVGARHDLARSRAELDAQHRAALLADRQAFATALTAGKPEPKRSAVEVAAKLEDLGRRSEALDVALDRAYRELVDVAYENRAAWIAQTHKETVAARQDATEAVAAASAALAKYGQAAAREGFALEFPQRTKLAAGDTFVRGLVSPNGSPYAAGEVIAAVAAALAPSPAPDARTVSAVVPDPLIERVA